MLNAGVTLCFLVEYHTVIVNTLEHEWRRSDNQMRQFYNTGVEKQNKINEERFNREKELKEEIGVASSKTKSSQEQ